MEINKNLDLSNKNTGAEIPGSKFEKLRLSAKIKDALVNIYGEYSKGGSYYNIEDGSMSSFLNSDPELIKKVLSEAGIDTDGLIVKIKDNEDYAIGGELSGHGAKTFGGITIEVYRGEENENSLVFKDRFTDVNPYIES